ncbi:IL17A [Vulpes lagopus]
MVSSLNPLQHVNVSDHRGAKSYKNGEDSATLCPFRNRHKLIHLQSTGRNYNDSGDNFIHVFQSLLLLLSLVAIIKAGIAFPQNPGCRNTEDKNFPQHVKVNLNILNRNTNSRRPSDYYNRSTSPWNLHRNEDPERYPSVIWEAKCRHLGCVNNEGNINYHMNSVPIQQEILVLRRESQHCPHSFRLEKMLVAVGCTCVTPIVRHVA